MAKEKWLCSDVTTLSGIATEVTCIDRLSGGKASEYLYQLKRMDCSIRVRVVRRRRKTMALYVEKGRLAELRVPTNCSWHDIHGFLASKYDWILVAEEELAARITGPANEYEPGGEISYLGKRYKLELTRSRYNIVEPGEHGFYVACCNPTRRQTVEKQIVAWYRKQAEQLFPERIAEVCRLFGDTLAPSGITIRKMKARWGSCSSKGDICLNLLLMMEGLPQIDFVIAHELCHLRHFAHNRAFYDLLNQVMPDWRQREAILGQAV